MGKVKKLIKEPDGQRDIKEINGVAICYDSKDNSNSRRKKQKNNLTEKSFCCHVCDKTLKSKEGIRCHVRVVHEGYRFICRIDKCYTFFTTKEAFLEHRLIHTGERPLSCKVCNKTFRQRSTLRAHEAIHKGLRSYACKVCQRAFTDRRNLNRHLKIHTGETPHTCNVCQRAFIRKDNLKAHLKIHTGENSHICEVCQRGFRHLYSLKRHFRIHTGDTPFSCAHCGKKFIQKNNLKLHLVKCFKKYGFENQFKQQSSNDENQSGEVHICEVCLREFTKSSDFVTHLKTHTKDKSFSCAHCGNTFMKKRHLKVHLVKCFGDYGFENQFREAFED